MSRYISQRRQRGQAQHYLRSVPLFSRFMACSTIAHLAATVVKIGSYAVRDPTSSLPNGRTSGIWRIMSYITL